MIVFIAGFITGGIVGYTMYSILEMADDQETEEESEEKNADND